MTKLKKLKKEELDFLYALLEKQREGIYFGEYLLDILDEYEISEELFFKLVDYTNKVGLSDYMIGGFDVFNCIETHNFSIPENRIDDIFKAAGTEDSFINYDIFHKHPEWLDLYLRNQYQYNLRINFPKKSTALPDRLIKIINEKIDEWIKDETDLNDLYKLGKLPSEIICKLIDNGFYEPYVNDQYYRLSYAPGNNITKDSFITLAKKIVNEKLVVSSSVIPSNYEDLYKFFQSPDTVDPSKIKISKKRLLRDYPFVLTAPNSKIRNWATGLTLDQKTINLDNKEYRITGTAKEKLLEILSTYKGDELEKKLKEVLC